MNFREVPKTALPIPVNAATMVFAFNTKSIAGYYT